MTAPGSIFGGTHDCEPGGDPCRDAREASDKTGAGTSPRAACSGAGTGPPTVTTASAEHTTRAASTIDVPVGEIERCDQFA